MVRTECRKCKHCNSHPTQGCIYATYELGFTAPTYVWAVGASWSSPDHNGIAQVAEAETLCPGFEPTPDKSSVVESNNGQKTAMATTSTPQATDTISVEPRKRSEGNSQAILDGSKVSEIPTGCQCAAGPWRYDMENMPTDGTRIWVALKECDGFKYCRYSSARCTYKGEDGFEVWSLCPGIGIGREQIEAWAEIMPVIGGK
jgi:hypothetical protein